MSDERATPPPNKSEIDAEAQHARLEFARAYGWHNFAVAAHLATLRNALGALRDAPSDSNADYRLNHYTKASLALASIIELTVPEAQDVVKIVECAGRMDAVVDHWVLDALEQHGELPPYPKLG